MKKVLFLALVLSGCGFFEPQEVVLRPEVVAALEAKLGPIEEALKTNGEQTRALAEELTGLKVESVSQSAETKKTLIKIESTGSEIAEQTAAAAVLKLAKDPSPFGLAEAILGAIGAAGAVVLGRQKLAKEGAGLKVKVVKP